MTLAHQFARALPPDKQRTLDKMRQEFDDQDSKLLVQYTMERESIPDEYEQRAWDFVEWCAGRKDGT